MAAPNIKRLMGSSQADMSGTECQSIQYISIVKSEDIFRKLSSEVSNDFSSE